jgi:hypothetical protein
MKSVRETSSSSSSHEVHRPLVVETKFASTPFFSSDGYELSLCWQTSYFFISFLFRDRRNFEYNLSQDMIF